MYEIGVSHQMVEDRDPESSVQWQRPKGGLLGTATKEYSTTTEMVMLSLTD
jgi:hypothetical protein